VFPDGGPQATQADIDPDLADDARRFRLPGRCSGRDPGNTESTHRTIGRVTTGGLVTEFVIRSSGYPTFITTGPDGNLWFTLQLGNKIGRLSTTGILTEFEVPTIDSFPQAIAPGPDGNLWFTEENGNQIGRITTLGVVTEFPIPTANSAPIGLTAGPDGNIWFTEWHGNKIGMMQPGL
jgi:virginiamycin B lyase